MKTLRDYFIDYDDNKRLHQSDYDKIREKRDLILNELANDGRVITSFSSIVLGSTKLLTGVKYDDGNYDIDCGLRLNIKESERQNFSAKDCKDSIFEVMNKYRCPKYNTKCITAVYHIEREEKFHIDFSVFAYDDGKNTYYLADGKANEGVKWIKSYPEELIEYLTMKNDDYRRIVRLLKIWNHYAFKNSKKHSKAPSVALTLETKNWFKSNVYNNDLDTLLEIARRLSNRINGNNIYLSNPFTGENIFYKMNGEPECVLIFKEKLDYFISIIEEAKNTSYTSIYDTCVKLRKVFPDFPLPELEKTKKSFGTNARYA